MGAVSDAAIAQGDAGDLEFRAASAGRHRISHASPWTGKTLAYDSTACFIHAAYAALSHCARGLHIAGPLDRPRACGTGCRWRRWPGSISPPRASTSRANWPLATTPPIDGLQLILPMVSRLPLTSAVRQPSRAAAAAASMPAWPAPMTITSKELPGMGAEYGGAVLAASGERGSRHQNPGIFPASCSGASPLRPVGPTPRALSGFDFAGLAGKIVGGCAARIVSAHHPRRPFFRLQPVPGSDAPSSAN